MFGAVILIYVKCSKLAEFFFQKPPLYLKNLLTPHGYFYYLCI